MFRAYISRSCPNCTRFVEGVHRVPQLKGCLQIMDIDSLPPESKQGLQYVPTVVDSSGHMHVGTKAFEWLKQFDAEVELDAAPDLFGGSTNSLCYAELDGEGFSYAPKYGDF